MFVDREFDTGRCSPGTNFLDCVSVEPINAEKPIQLKLNWIAIFAAIKNPA